MGIEPTPSAWKAEVLPLNYTRLGQNSGQPTATNKLCNSSLAIHVLHQICTTHLQLCSRFSTATLKTKADQTGGGGRIRTYEGISRQIYSLFPLAAWVPLRKARRGFCPS